MSRELNQAVRMVCERGITKHLIVFTSTTQSGFQSHFEEFVKKSIELEEGIHVEAKNSNAFRKQTKAVLKRHKIKTFDLTIKKSMIPNAGQGVFTATITYISR